MIIYYFKFLIFIYLLKSCVIPYLIDPIHYQIVSFKTFNLIAMLIAPIYGILYIEYRIIKRGLILFMEMLIRVFKKIDRITLLFLILNIVTFLFIGVLAMSMYKITYEVLTITNMYLNFYPSDQIIQVISLIAVIIMIIFILKETIKLLKEKIDNFNNKAIIDDSKNFINRQIFLYMVIIISAVLNILVEKISFLGILSIIMFILTLIVQVISFKEIIRQYFINLKYEEIIMLVDKIKRNNNYIDISYFEYNLEYYVENKILIINKPQKLSWLKTREKIKVEIASDVIQIINNK